MIDVMPKRAYFDDETGYWRKMPVFAAIVGSILGTLNMWLTMGSVLTTVQVFGRGIGGGVMFAILFTIFFGSFAWWTVWRAHAQGPPQERAKHETQYRLVCSLIRSGRPVPGALYLGRSGAFFVSRARRDSSDPALPLSDLAVSSTEGVLNWTQRCMRLRIPIYLQLAGNNQRVAFVVPAARRTIPRVTELVAALKAEEGRTTTA